MNKITWGNIKKVILILIVVITISGCGNSRFTNKDFKNEKELIEAGFIETTYLEKKAYFDPQYLYVAVIENEEIIEVFSTNQNFKVMKDGNEFYINPTPDVKLYGDKCEIGGIEEKMTDERCFYGFSSANLKEIIISKTPLLVK